MLTHCGLVTPYRVRYFGHWPMQWLVVCWSPSHYLNNCWLDICQCYPGYSWEPNWKSMGTEISRVAWQFCDSLTQFQRLELQIKHIESCIAAQDTAVRSLRSLSHPHPDRMYWMKEEGERIKNSREKLRAEVVCVEQQINEASNQLAALLELRATKVSCPADPLRNNDVVITPKRCHFDVITLLLRHVFGGWMRISYMRNVMPEADRKARTSNYICITSVSMGYTRYSFVPVCPWYLLLAQHSWYHSTAPAECCSTSLAPFTSMV